jgi:hypothetical protein
MVDRAVVICSVYKNTRLLEFQEFYAAFVEACHVCPCDIAIFLDGPLPPRLSQYIASLESSSLFKTYTICSESNIGLAGALNALIVDLLSRGYQYFIRADTDDLFPPSRFARLITFLRDNPSVDIVGSWARKFGAINDLVELPLSHSDICSHFASSRLTMVHSSVAFRRSFFSKAGLYEPSRLSLIEDLRLWSSGFRSSAIFANIPEVLYYIRTSSDQASRRVGMRLSLAVFFVRLDHISSLGYGIAYYLNAIYELLLRSLASLVPPQCVIALAGKWRR